MSAITSANFAKDFQRGTEVTEFEVVLPDGTVAAAYPSRESAEVQCSRMPAGSYVRALMTATERRLAEGNAILRMDETGTRRWQVPTATPNRKAQS
jgi:hypothetical protein